MVKKSMAVVFNLMLSVNSVQAITTNTDTAVSDINRSQLVRDILALIILISVILFLIGAYKFFKGKKKKDFKILSFVGKIIVAFILSIIFLVLYIYLFIIHSYCGNYQYF